MICKFCKVKEADKKNTHYLTDAIIRNCLNLNGSNQREKGFYSTIDSRTPFIEFKFQRIDEETLIEKLGRKPTEEEIENAKNNIPCSVDYVFCSECEKKFTEIETEFIQKILPKFREDDLTGKEDIHMLDNILCRNFFYLQIFRSAVCNAEIYQLPPEFIEKLRSILFNKEKDTSIPLTVTYLQTIGELKSYTGNLVRPQSNKNPYIIFMNDFVIQCYDNKNNIAFDEFYGLNEHDYKEYINIDEDRFRFKIIQNEKRKELCNNIFQYMAKSCLKAFDYKFELLFLLLFGIYPPQKEVDDFYIAFSKYMRNSKIPLSEQNMLGFVKNYFLANFNEFFLSLNTAVFYFLQSV